MKGFLLMLIFCPLLATCQEVQPILSPYYQQLIKNDSLKSRMRLVDSTNSMHDVHIYHYRYSLTNAQVKKIRIVRQQMRLQHSYNTYLSITGGMNANVELQYLNRQAAIQSTYAQGRSMNGSLVWQGAETNELFSFGPLLSALEFDGNTYSYDVNGRLVPKGTGNSLPAKAYDNSIIRPASLITNSYNLEAKLHSGWRFELSVGIKGGVSREKTVIHSNRNAADHYTLFLESKFLNTIFSANYSHRHERFDHSNRNGFINRVYQNSLLAPASFSTKQGAYINNGQRSYSQYADNPDFLLDNALHISSQLQKSGMFSIIKTVGNFKFTLAQQAGYREQYSNESYQPGTAFFTNGENVVRTASTNHYSFTSNLRYRVYLPGDDFKIDITGNYIYSAIRSGISYGNDFPGYGYQRSAHDAAITFAPSYNKYDFEAGTSLSNKFYTSNTVTKDAYFLPAINGYLLLKRLFGVYSFSGKLHTTFNRFNSELPIDRSYASVNLVQYKVTDALTYLPVKEVSSYELLDPIRHYEFTAGVDLNYKGIISLLANYFARRTADDIFPIMKSGKINLVNIATSCDEGIELETEFNYRLGKKKIWNISHTVSYVAYRNKVTSVRNSFDYAAIAGFSDVHKAIVKGQTPGVIVGSAWLRDKHGNKIIGQDGFPLVNTTPKVIGNPTPDFTMKFAYGVSYKSKWRMSIDLEWRKGGDMWNGTQAILDYYGKSAITSTQRTTVNYVFDGVQQNGGHNTIPVDFYNPSLPVTQNRWVRYGVGGVAEDYIQKGDCFRLRVVSITYNPTSKYLQRLSFNLYANNILLWSPYNGADPNQLLYDQAGTSGLDFFNLPSSRSFGFNVSFQF